LTVFADLAARRRRHGVLAPLALLLLLYAASAGAAVRD
jgi:hypothetical protein